MRKISFRGKRVDNGEWVQSGNLMHFVGDEYYIPAIGGSCIATQDEADNVIGLKECAFYKVIPETVGQYTGLTDKNGERIFEGDYIVCSQEIQGNWIDRHIEMGYVEMKHGAFGLHRKQGWYRPFKDWLEDYEYEVLGNIYDNPELLGGDEV